MPAKDFLNKKVNTNESRIQCLKFFKMFKTYMVIGVKVRFLSVIFYYKIAIFK